MDRLRRPNPERRLWVVNSSRAGLLGWLLRYYAFAAFALFVVLAWAGWMGFRHLASELPDLEHIERYETSAPGVTRIYATEGTLLAELAREHRAYTKLQDIPPALVNAFLAAEDRRFFSHGGLDWRGLARATLANFRSGTISQGGSTITQQVAKGFLTHDRTLARKIREAILAIKMESRLGKARILEIYLNKIFLGHGAYGVTAAASRYFDKRLDALTLDEAALIAGLARAPSRYSPVAHRERAKARRDVVLQDMVEAGYVTEAEREVATTQPIALATPPDVFRLRAPYFAEHVRREVMDTLGESSVLEDGLRIETTAVPELARDAHDAIDMALRKIDRRQGWRGPVTHLDGEHAKAALLERLSHAYGDDPLRDTARWRLALVDTVERSGAYVHLGKLRARLPLGEMSWASRYDRNTGINDVAIRDARHSLELGDVVWVRAVEVDDDAPAKHDENGLPVVELGQTPRLEAALYSFDHETGYVQAMEGGHDYDRSQFNRTTQACRQPGSVFKAIYYALALESDEWTMATVLEDRPYEPEPGEEWNPQNLHGTVEGKVLLRSAFIYSLNLPSIRLFVRLGADNVVAFARKLGFTSELIADKALSLGASCVYTNELSRAFGILVRGGTWIDPIYVRRITDKHGTVLVDNRHPHDGGMNVAGRIDRMAALALAVPQQIVDERTAFLITRLMREVVTAGLGRRASRLDVPAGGKSGTASKKLDTTDTWFVGFTSRYVTSAWVGDDTYERSIGDEDASYTTALPMWTDFMERATHGIPHGDVPLERPPGLESQWLHAKSGEEPIPGEPSALMYFRG